MAMLLRLYTHNWRPGACPRDPMALARGKALWPLHPRRPMLELLGQWVPTSGAGATACDVARGEPLLAKTCECRWGKPAGDRDRRGTGLNSRHKGASR